MTKLTNKTTQATKTNSFLAAALKLSAEKKAKRASQVEWSDNELATLNSWVDLIKQGETSKAVIVAIAKQHRTEGQPIEGIADDKSYSAIKSKLDELYSPKAKQA